MNPEIAQRSVAVVGMSARLPGASDVETFWQNLLDSKESITAFTDEELLAAGVDAALLADDQVIRAGGVLADVTGFDAALFGLTPREAEVMDPQHRLFLECSWEAMEHAGQLGDGPRRAGVYAGCAFSTYLLNHLVHRPELLRTFGEVELLSLNDKDWLGTHVSYRLDLTGPCVSVQTGCSTSLVAIHTAVQSLLAGECDLALAGGAHVVVPQPRALRYQEGGILALDGHCRAFDADARGTVWGNGVGVVVLKRLDEALADRDTVHAVIRGSAVSNDGAAKASFGASSVAGQAAAMVDALAVAEVEPASVDYVEAHGTATALGDPVEATALSRVYGAEEREHPLLVGSVKTNIGHADSAAGVASLIKAAVALREGVIPATLNYRRPNPNIDYSRLEITSEARQWPASRTPRRAAVNGLGIGGTNAHVVLEQAPPAAPTEPDDRAQLLVLSAHTPTALTRAEERLAAYLAATPDASLADVAHTLQVGRRSLAHRRALVATDLADARRGLAERQGVGGQAAAPARPVAFLLPGQGAQLVDMGRELYESEPVFRQQLDHCLRLLREHTGLELAPVLFPSEADRPGAAERLTQTRFAQPALFVVETALARLLESWGVRPAALLGHSLGEYVAAHLAGVFTLVDAVRLVTERGRLMQTLPAGSMLAVALPAAEAADWLDGELAVAVHSGPDRCVVGGPEKEVAALAERLAAAGVPVRPLSTSHAFHTPMVEPILADFADLVRGITRSAPRIPFVSNLTGGWITDAEATSVAYWVRHLREPVRLAAGLAELSEHVLVEVGPGRGLVGLARRQGRPVAVTATTLPPDRPEPVAVREALGRLWAHGTAVDWPALHAGRARRRVPLPTYPFERRHFWAGVTNLEAGAAARPATVEAPATAGQPVLTTATAEPVAQVEDSPRDVLASIWYDLLGVRVERDEDSFFDLGGDSMNGVRLAALISERFEVACSPGMLSQSPRLLDQVALVAQLRGATGGGQLVRLHQGGDGRPVFLVHPIGGTVFCLQELADRLGAERPVYALEADPDDTPPDIPALAARYLRELREVQPSGPYQLAGASFGGVVAYEMAQQLTRDGVQVTSLSLLDSPAPGQLGGLDDAAIREQVLTSAAARRWYTELPAAAATRWMSALRERFRALEAYRPRPYRGTVHYFLAAEQLGWLPEHADRYWTGLVDGLGVHEIPGDHNTMLGAARLGDLLSEVLRG